MRGLAEPCRGDSVVVEQLLQASVLPVGVHVREVRKLLHVLVKNRSPMREVVDVVGLNRILVERAAPAASDAQILSGLQRPRANDSFLAAGG